MEKILKEGDSYNINLEFDVTKDINLEKLRDYLKLALEKTDRIDKIKLKTVNKIDEDFITLETLINKELNNFG